MLQPDGDTTQTGPALPALKLRRHALPASPRGLRRAGKGPANLQFQPLPEPSDEFKQVHEFHHPVSIEIEGAKVSKVVGTSAEGAHETGEVPEVDVAVAVAIAIETEERINAVAACLAVTVAIEGPSQAVVNPVATDSQGVVAVGQRATDQVRPGEGEDSNTPAVKQRGCESEVSPNRRRAGVARRPHRPR